MSPIHLSTVPFVTNSSQHCIGLVQTAHQLRLSCFQETLMAPILFRAEKGHDPVWVLGPPPHFPVSGWRHRIGGGGGQENLIFDSLTDAVSCWGSTQPSFVVLFNSQLANCTPPPIDCAILTQCKMSEQFWRTKYYKCVGCSNFLFDNCNSKQEVKFPLDP